MGGTASHQRIATSPQRCWRWPVTICASHLQVITSAHDVLRQILDSDRQREELARAADAATRLGNMLSQLYRGAATARAIGRSPPCPVRLRPIFEDLASEFAEPHGGRGSNFASSRPALPSQSPRSAERILGT